jgi:cytoskeleton protein RodZ
MGSPKESGVGSLLKGEREKRGFNLDQLSQVTRLRKHYIEALEDENWDNLPSPVYVKGFIRSYAQGLGFDAQEAISLYEGVATVEEDIPKPLTGLKEPKSKVAYFIIPLIAILFLGIYMLLDYKDFFLSDLPLTNQEVKGPAPTLEQGMSPVVQGQDSSPGGTGEPEQLPTDNPIQGPPVEDTVVNHPAGPVESVIDYSIPVPPGTVGLVLTGIVNMGTYIKIYVDDNPPKEFIFQPGSRPQWTASEGFYLVVGNAAGIDFDFNGKKITDLGPPGKVIRIRFPEDFEPEINGN